MSETLECPVCGSEIFEADADGLFWEDEQATCQECGTICRVAVEGSSDEEHPGTASVSTNEEIEDIGQPKCDGTCGAVPEFVGTSCRWNCPRAIAWKAASVHRSRPANVPKGADEMTDRPDDKWPALWTEADASTPFEPWPSVQARTFRLHSTFLGHWGGYDVWTYRGGTGREIGVVCLDKNRFETGLFPLIGIPPRPEGKVWIDGALAVARALGLFADKFAYGPYSRKYDEESQPETGEKKGKSNVQLD